MLVSTGGDLTWATIENGLAIICACLPTFRPLLSGNTLVASTLNSWYNSLLSTSRGSQSKQSGHTASVHNDDRRQLKRYNQIEDGTQDDIHLTNLVGGSRTGDDSVAGKDFSLNSIKVKHITEVV